MTPAPSTRSPVSLVTRLAGVNIAPGAHSALTSSPLCARLSQVMSPLPHWHWSAHIALSLTLTDMSVMFPR